MLFSSADFLLFFLFYFAAHLLTPPRYRLFLVILGSTYFYAYWNPIYVGLPYALAFVAFLAGLWVEDGDRFSRTTRTALAIVALLLPLFTFKYAGFFFDQLADLFRRPRSTRLDLALPLGISFVTFTLIAYVVDVSRRQHPAERRFSRLLGCTLFFPHLIAGPIVRPSRLIAPLAAGKHAHRSRIFLGVVLFSQGLVKKLLIADSMAALVNPIYSPSGAHTALEYVLAIYGFAIQIYCDFSGYTDMALGLAALLGIKLPGNFEAPYVCSSVIEFWRRWHITLSTWLRDYLYIPLGGNRGGLAKQLRNMFLTMLLGGLWHGANWTFVYWGAYHGLALGGNHLLRRLARKNAWPSIPKWISAFLTFHIVVVGWILFRAPDMATAWRVFRGPFAGTWNDVPSQLAERSFAVLLILFFFLVHRWDRQAWLRLAVRKVSRPFLWSVVTAGWLLAIACSSGTSAQFIYFVF